MCHFYYFVKEFMAILERQFVVYNTFLDLVQIPKSMCHQKDIHGAGQQGSIFNYQINYRCTVLKIDTCTTESVFLLIL